MQKLMQPTSEQLAVAVTAAANQELSKALDRIKHCLDQLTDDQVWWRWGRSSVVIVAFLDPAVWWEPRTAASRSKATNEIGWLSNWKSWATKRRGSADKFPGVDSETENAEPLQNLDREVRSGERD